MLSFGQDLKIFRKMTVDSEIVWMVESVVNDFLSDMNGDNFYRVSQWKHQEIFFEI